MAYGAAGRYTIYRHQDVMCTGKEEREGKKGRMTGHVLLVPFRVACHPLHKAVAHGWGTWVGHMAVAHGRGTETPPCQPLKAWGTGTGLGGARVQARRAGCVRSTQGCCGVDELCCAV